MTMMSDFCGGFGDFETLYHDAELGQYNVFVWPSGSSEEDSFPNIFRIIGYTKLKNDYMLHLITVPPDNLSEDTDNLLNRVSFIRLRQLFGDCGFTMIPIPEEKVED